MRVGTEYEGGYTSSDPEYEGGYTPSERGLPLGEGMQTKIILHTDEPMAVQ